MKTIYQTITSETFADNKLKMAYIVEVAFDRTETFWEKEKTLVTTIFSSSPDVFKSYISQVVKSKKYCEKKIWLS